MPLPPELDDNPPAPPGAGGATDQGDAPMNETQARTIRIAHDGYVKTIYRKPKTTLAHMYREELAARGQYNLFGGPASKDELISALVELRYPLASMNESVHVLYHVDGISNDACDQCNA
jgi:hypothetical protein